MIRSCLNCSNEFTTLPSRVEKGNGKYCSKVCFFIYSEEARVSFLKTFAKEHSPWNKGVKRTKKCLQCETLFTSSNQGISSRTYCSKQCYHLSTKGKTAHNRGTKWSKELRDRMIGSNSHAWIDGRSTDNEIVRHSIELANWRRKVFERDNYTCQDCGQVGGKLNADHIKSFALYPELRFDIDNGQTLCDDCHKVKTSADIKYIRSVRYWSKNEVYYA